MNLNRKQQSDILMIKIMIITLLVTILVLTNKENIKSETTYTGNLARLGESSPIDILKSMKIYLLNLNKFEAFKLNKDLKGQVIPSINLLRKDLSGLKAQEDMLRSQIDSLMSTKEIYVHSKIELSSYMIDAIKNKGLIYEINYNYAEPIEESEITTPIEEGVDVVTGFTNTFSIKIFQINIDDNYSKLLEVLDEMYIKEPYEISKVNISYDEITKSYSFMLVIEL